MTLQSAGQDENTSSDYRNYAEFKYLIYYFWHVLYYVAIKAILNYSEFIELAEYKKMKLIWNEGVIVSRFQFGVYRIDLYQVHGFYVEERVHSQYNLRKKFTVYQGDHCPNHHLRRIDVSLL